MKSKRIKLIIFHPYSRIGGADKSLSRLINGLNSKKYEFIFVTLNKPYIENYLEKKVKIIQIKSSRTLFSIFKIRKFLKSFTLDEKIIFFSNQNFANIISFAILYKIRNIKHVIFERNHIDELNISETSIEFFKNKTIKFLIRVLYKKADIILGNANQLSKDLSKITKTKVQTIYNPAFDRKIFNLSNKLYLGDSGSYLLGFAVGALLIYIYDEISFFSPFFVVLLLWYPCFENLFSIIRKYRFNLSPLRADNKHLHHLLFYFVKKKFKLSNLFANNLASVLINLINLTSFIISINFIYNSLIIISIITFLILLYVTSYLLLFNFRYKKILIVK